MPSINLSNIMKLHGNAGNQTRGCRVRTLPLCYAAPATHFLCICRISVNFRVFVVLNLVYLAFINGEEILWMANSIIQTLSGDKESLVHTFLLFWSFSFSHQMIKVFFLPSCLCCCSLQPWIKGHKSTRRAWKDFDGNCSQLKRVLLLFSSPKTWSNWNF